MLGLLLFPGLFGCQDDQSPVCYGSAEQKLEGLIVYKDEPSIEQFDLYAVGGDTFEVNGMLFRIPEVVQFQHLQYIWRRDTTPEIHRIVELDLCTGCPYVHKLSPLPAEKWTLLGQLALPKLADLIATDGKIRVFRSQYGRILVGNPEGHNHHIYNGVGNPSLNSMKLAWKGGQLLLYYKRGTFCPQIP